MSSIKSRVVSVVIIILILLLIFNKSYYEYKLNENLNVTLEKHNRIAIGIIDNINNDIVEINLEKTGTLDNLVFIVDVTDIINYNDKYIIIGNTSTEKYYSGEIHIVLNDIDNININNTYKFIVEPIISMSKPPEVNCIYYEKASNDDIIQLHNNRQLNSNFESCMEIYKTMSLDDIILHANSNYTVWTNNEINTYIDYINSKGYSDEFEVKSIVKVISTPDIIE